MERIDESLLVLHPPTMSAVITLHAAYLIPHFGEIGVASFDTATNELAAVRHRVRQKFEKLLPLRDREPIGICHHSKSSRAIRRYPAEPGCAEVIVDGNAHARELRQ